jgi:uncharacterized protein (DUF1697 family)
LQFPRAACIPPELETARKPGLPSRGSVIAGPNPSAQRQNQKPKGNSETETRARERNDIHAAHGFQPRTIIPFQNGNRRLRPSASMWAGGQPARQLATAASPRYFSAATMSTMALIVFFRGINVGGHRAFRPSALAKELSIYNAVNVGAAGTLVVHKPGSRAKFLAELRRKLPFEATIAFCTGSDLIRLETDNPFGTLPPPADAVQFVSILSEAGCCKVPLPISLPEGEEWLVRIIGSKNRLVYGVYRRHMKTIGYLGQIDRLFGSPATTRSWKTILSVLRILKSRGRCK